MIMIGSKGFLVAALAALLAVSGSANAGTNNFSSAPASPASAESAMFTLQDIFVKVDMPYTNLSKRAGAFAEPAGGPTNGTLNTTDEIMALVVNRAPVANTGQTISYQAGDDATYQSGVAWPGPRFVTNKVSGAEVAILDRLTGLIWARNANLAGTLNVADAISYCNDLTYAAYDDWRLPNVAEMLSIIDYGRYDPALPAGHPFQNVVNNFYWTSSYAANVPATMQWPVNLSRGQSYGYNYNKTTAYYVWPVRSAP